MIIAISANTGSIYFTEAVDDAIFAYNQLHSSAIEERNVIFSQKIYYPLHELCENIVSTFKFSETCGESYDELVAECISFAYERLNKFRKDKGKAFSYLSVICKRFLIQKTINEKKRRNITISPINIGETNTYDLGLFSILEDEKIDRDEHIKKLTNLLLKFADESKKTNNKKVAFALIDILENIANLDIYYKDMANKKSVYLLLREITGLKTRTLTRIINKIKDSVYDEYREWCKD